MEPRGSRRSKPWKNWNWNRIKDWKHWTWKGWTLFSVSLLLFIVLAYAAYQAVGIYNALDNFEKSEPDSRFKDVVDGTAEKPPEWEGKERVNIVLLGGDARGLDKGQVARSDSMLVVSVDPVTKRAHLLSILRDTYTDIPGHHRNRINTAITLGGPPLAMKTIGELLGLQIHYFVYADFEGFKALVDSIGGVDYDVEKNMKYTDNADGNRYDIDLKKGFQHLNGDQALQYVRFRHDAMSDFTRTERQRNFMKAVVAKLQSTWNIVRMKEILESIQPHIETNMKVADMLKLGQLGLKIQMAGSAQVPPMELIADERVGGASVLGVRDEDALRKYVQDVLASTSTDPAPTIEVKQPARSNTDRPSRTVKSDDPPAKSPTPTTKPPAAESQTGGSSKDSGGQSTGNPAQDGGSGGTETPVTPVTPESPTTPAPTVPGDGSGAPEQEGEGANGGGTNGQGDAGTPVEDGTADPSAPTEPTKPADPTNAAKPPASGASAGTAPGAAAGAAVGADSTSDTDGASGKSSNNSGSAGTSNAPAPAAASEQPAA
jgi:polyisoprenyl-teichoic acid--peptidoglycan teichoic acid transferase